MTDQWHAVQEDWEIDPEEMARLQRNAMFAAGLGIAAQSAALCVCCTYGLGAIPVMSMGLLAALFGKFTLDTGVDGAARAYAMVGVVTGAIATLWGGFILLMCGLYIGIYVVLLGSLGVLGNM